MHKNHQDPKCTKIRCAQRKGLKFYQTRSNAVILYDTLPAYCISEAIVMKSEEIKNQKVYVSPRPPPKISYKDNWTCDLDSDLAGSSKDIQRIELKPNTQLSSSGRLVTKWSEETLERTKFDRDTLNQEKLGNVADPTSSGRPARGHESTERCVLTPKHYEYDQTSLGRPVTVDQKEEHKIDFRVPGLSHALVKEAENFRVQELVKKIESHPHREALQAYLQQNNVCNPVSKNPKDDPRIGQCGVIRVVRNYTKSTMFSLSSLLESRNCLLHLWTILDLQRTQKEV